MLTAYYSLQGFPRVHDFRGAPRQPWKARRGLSLQKQAQKGWLT